MVPALTIGGSLLVLVLVIFALRQFLRGLRARGRVEIDKRYTASEVLLAETLAQSFGQQSRGVTQLRGSGALALTTTELFFMMYVPARELRIPLSCVKTVSLVRSHLGKTQVSKLLHVRYTAEGIDDAIAWRIPHPDTWRAKIESLRAASSPLECRS